jgi:hypothetical protein
MNRNLSPRFAVAIVILLAAVAPLAHAQRTISADVVALDQAFYNNRLGAFQAGGMIFALRGDVVNNVDPKDPNLTEGKVMLRPDKRPRPMVLRMDVGDCLQINFQNLLAPVPSASPIPPALFPPSPFDPAKLKTTPDPNSASELNSQPATRLAGVHVMGMELKEIQADGSWIGANPNSLAQPGEKKTYKFCTVAEGAYLLYSTAADVGVSNGFGGQLAQGLFGSVTVQPKKAEWFRSQVTRDEMNLATYRSNQLPPNMQLAPKGNPQETFTSDGKTYKLWILTTTGNPSFTTEVTEVNQANDPVNQSGFLKTRDFHPLINYQATYPAGATYPNGNPIPDGTPVLAMLDKNLNIRHSDLTAIITGPNAGLFPKSPDPVFLPNPTYPNRDQPYREFAIHYHDDFVATQAFPVLRPDSTEGVSYALTAARDFFAINYGMAAIGPEVWANRIGVGPMYQCVTCKFEEFFLSSWAVADPAMIVDCPANSSMGKGIKATKALYPDDPSNVYHSYIGDHVEFRILHAGTNITHVHHQHAHQWLHSPNSDESDYRDSQMISPGGAYTLDMTYFGSGNLNQTVGDSIFHCHFYPHFAQGMWSLWRTHDVFEAGTKLDTKGIPVLDWNRALPDGEIANGTPIPALVPMPTLAMAPTPVRTRICPVYNPADYVGFAGDACPAPPLGAKSVGNRGLVSKTDINDPGKKEKNPGYPFFVPGVGGQRPPHPPLDFAPDEDAMGNQKVIAGKKQYLDGGLPRAQFLRDDGQPCTSTSDLNKCAYEQHNAWDFTKEGYSLVGVEVDEEGTNVEQVAMAAHAIRKHPSTTPSGKAADYILNGQKPKPGAPFADPAIDIFGDPIPNADCQKHESGCTQYKVADIQIDAVLNKKGWHYPQQRLSSLWGDVKDYLGNTKDGKSSNRRPEPLFFRANSDKVIEYWLANLVPADYELDDFQVRTPTDVIGQHIHLVKFDVTSSDGAGNGFNYEDGTFSNQEVVGLIHQVNTNGGLYNTTATQQNTLKSKEIPYFASVLPGKYPGAQATIQRWYADPVWDCATPVQPGKAPLPCKVDQDRTLRTVFTHDHFGPSTHQQVGLYAGLVIEPKDSKWFNSTTGEQLGGRSEGDHDGGPTTFQANINTVDPNKSYREFLLEFQDRQLAYLNTSITTPKPYKRYFTNPGGFWGWADPTNAINAPSGPLDLIPGGPPTPHLITNQFGEGTYSLSYYNEPLAYRISAPSGKSPTPEQANLVNVFRSIDRAYPELNVQPTQGTPIDPTQPGGFLFPPPQIGAEQKDPYTPLLRAYEGDRIQIRNLVGAHMAPHSFHIHGLNWHFEPSLNASGFRSTQGMGISEHYEFLFHLPQTTQPKQADYLYITTSDTTGLQYGNWGLIRGYNYKDNKQGNLVSLSDTQAKAFPGGKPIPPLGPPPDTCKPGAPARSFKVTAVFANDALGSPLVYNARGGVGTPGVNQITDPNALMYVLTDDLVNGKLKPAIPREPLVLRAAAGECITVELTNGLPPPNVPLNTGIGAQPGLANATLQTSHDVGLHPQLLAYDVTTSDGFNIGFNDVVTIAPKDTPHTYKWYAGRVGHDANGKAVYTPVEFGAVNLAPADPLMQENFGLAGALIIEPQGSTWQTDDNSRAQATVTKADKTSFREAVVMVQDDLALGVQALNYRSEPFPYRYLNPNYLQNDPALSLIGAARSQSDTLVAADPQTPVFVAGAGVPFRMRVLHPAGINEQVFELHGHTWQEEPYSSDSTRIVDNNPLSQWTGSRDAFGPNANFDVVLKHAGGSSAVQGDYLFRTFIGTDFLNGMWGLVRVGAPGKDVVTVTTYCAPPKMSAFTVAGVNTVNPSNHHMAASVTLTGTGLPPSTVPVDPMTGQWTFTSSTITTAPPTITVTSAQGGTRTTAELCPIIQVQSSKPGPTSTRETDRFRPKAQTVKDRD